MNATMQFLTEEQAQEKFSRLSQAEINELIFGFNSSQRQQRRNEEQRHRLKRQEREEF